MKRLPYVASSVAKMIWKGICHLDDEVVPTLTPEPVPPPQFTKTCDEQMDVVFLVDRMLMVDAGKLESVRAFLKEVFLKMTIKVISSV